MLPKLCVAMASLLLVLAQGDSQCLCGVQPKNDLQYFSMPSDGGAPNPRVFRTSGKGDHQTIWVTYEVPASNPPGFLARALRSQDGGRTWQRAPQYRESDFLNSDSDSVVYRYKVNGNDLLARSLDHGAHWTDCQFNVNGISALKFAQQKAGVQGASLHFGFAAINPRTPSTIYGTLSVWTPQSNDPSRGQDTHDLPGIYVSHDSGDNWTLFAPNLRGSSPNESEVLGIDPSHPNRMIGHGRSGMVMTSDGGKTWPAVGQQADLEAPAELKGRTEAIAKRKDPSAIPLHPQFTYLKVSQIQFQPGNDRVIYLVTNKGLYKTEDSAHTWCLVYAGRPGLFDVVSLFIDPENPSHLFVGTRDKVVVSDDGGCHFRELFDSKRFSAARSERNH